jgi:hypothetical protein
MNDVMHGYGIYRWADGSVYYGEYKYDNQDGYGYRKWSGSGNEYCGEWKNSMLWGEGIVKYQGKLYRDKYEKNNLISRSELVKVDDQK